MSKLFFYLGVMLASFLSFNDSDPLTKSSDKNNERIVEQVNVGSNDPKAK